MDMGEGVHVPVPHELHGAWQLAAATLQQTPSTQLPDVQSDAAAHAAPFGSLSPHLWVCVLQATPETQSPPLSQVSAHFVPLQLR